MKKMRIEDLPVVVVVVVVVVFLLHELAKQEGFWIHQEFIKETAIEIQEIEIFVFVS